MRKIEETVSKSKFHTPRHRSLRRTDGRARGIRHRRNTPGTVALKNQTDSRCNQLRLGTWRSKARGAGKERKGNSYPPRWGQRWVGLNTLLLVRTKDHGIGKRKNRSAESRPESAHTNTEQAGKPQKRKTRRHRMPQTAAGEPRYPNRDKERMQRTDACRTPGTKGKRQSTDEAHPQQTP